MIFSNVTTPNLSTLYRELGFGHMKRTELAQDWIHLQILYLVEVNIEVTAHEQYFHHLATTQRKIRCVKGRVTRRLS
jgi:hypothetical protein